MPSPMERTSTEPTGLEPEPEPEAEAEAVSFELSAAAPEPVDLEPAAGYPEPKRDPRRTRGTRCEMHFARCCGPKAHRRRQERRLEEATVGQVLRRDSLQHIKAKHEHKRHRAWRSELVTRWQDKRGQAFGYGMLLGAILPIGCALLLSYSRVLPRSSDLELDELQATLVRASTGELTVVSANEGSSTSLERIIEQASINPVNTTTGAVLFCCLAVVWASGGTLAGHVWVDKTMRYIGKFHWSQLSFSEKLTYLKEQVVCWSPRVFAIGALGCVCGTLVVHFILTPAQGRAAGAAVAAVLGAGTFGPLAGRYGSTLEQLSVAEPWRATHFRPLFAKLHSEYVWPRAFCGALRPKQMIASGLLRLVNLPGVRRWCSIPDSSGKRVPSVQLLVTWIATLLGAAMFSTIGEFLMTIVAKESTQNQQIGLLGGLNSTGAEATAFNTTAHDRTDPITLSLRLEQATSRHFRQLRKERDSLYEYDMTQVLLLGLASLIWDVFVVHYHLNHPPHPKFRLRFVRRMSIYVHIWSGASEVVLSVVSFVLYCNVESITRDECMGSDIDRHTLLVYGTVFCSVIHCITAAYQTPQVFGMHVVMVPVYTIVVVWKAISLLRLAMRPESLWLMVQLFFTHHIYVWCRAMHVILDQAGIFSDHVYSVSILFAGVICGPVAVGPAANFSVVAVIVLMAQLWLPYQSHEDQIECRLERRSNMLLNPRYRDALKVLVSGAANTDQRTDGNATDAQMGGDEAGAADTPAAAVPPDTATMFPGLHHLHDACNPEHHHLLHSNKTVLLRSPEISSLRVLEVRCKSGDVLAPGQVVVELEPLKVDGSTQQLEPASNKFESVQPELDPAPSDQGHDTGNNKNRHARAVAAVRNAGAELIADTQILEQMEDLQARVRVIFDALDSEGTGFVTKESITSLLVTWGVPYLEAMHCFDLFDSHSSVASRGEVSFHEFFVDWEPIWKFQLSRIGEAVAHFRLSQQLDENRQSDASRRPRLNTFVGDLLPSHANAVAAAEAKTLEAQLETSRVQEELRAAQERIAILEKAQSSQSVLQP